MSTRSEARTDVDRYWGEHTVHSPLFSTAEESLAYLEDAFTMTTDGEDPIANCYRPSEFEALCQEAGFSAEFRGGYLSRHELDCMRDNLVPALADSTLPAEHRSFLEQLTLDADGHPLWNRAYAGVGGVYTLR